MADSLTQTDLTRALTERFRLQDFRKGQLDVMQSVLGGRDALAVMPTGGGKSLCYQLPAVVRPGVAVIVTPLIALMKDQVRSLRSLGIPAGCLHSGQPIEEKRAVFAELNRSESFLIYLSPERVQKEGFEAWVKARRISLFGIDESHCISQWGHEFRPDYMRLTRLREWRPEVPILALTATATPQVLKDIERQLELRSPARHIHGFYRPNLYYQVESCDGESQKFALLRQALSAFRTGRVLIYCGTRRQAEDLVNELGQEFHGMGFYHAGLATEERTRIQTDYEKGKLRILAATNAFGMGIDHPDVRLVVHFQMPANIESLYQEMGRAGRDGKESTCMLLYSKRDKGLHSYFIRQSEASDANISQRWRALDAIISFAEGGECRHAGILTYFRDSQRIRECGHCDTCAPDSSRRVAAPSFAPATITRKSGKKRKTVDKAPLDREEELRAEVLKDWRKRYADEHDIPAFLVFSNKTLRELAKRNPRSLDELEEVHGFGPHKLEHLGQLVLEQLEGC